MSIPGAKRPLLGELFFRRDNFKGTLLLVEGPSDEQFWTPLVHKPDCYVMNCEGRSAVITTLRRFVEARTEDHGIVAVIDADWDRLDGVTPPHPSIFFTDGHDLETTLLSTRALARVVDTFGARDVIDRYEADTRTSIVDEFWRLGRLFGDIRWLHHLRPNVKGLGEAGHLVRQFTYENTWSVNFEGLIDHAVNTGIGSDPDHLGQLLEALPAGADVDVCQGHDLVELLLIAFQNRFARANRPLKGRRPEDVTSVLLAAASEEWLWNESLMGKNLLAWCDAHPPFQIRRRH